jgi:hypothetical protein
MNDNPYPIYIALVLFIYFLPAIVAWRRGHRNEYAIGILNTFLGESVKMCGVLMPRRLASGRHLRPWPGTIF